VKQNASIYEAVTVAWDSLQSSKLRSFLTLLGIILATSTLIAVMSVIHGMDVYIAEKVSSMGVDGYRIVRMAFVGNFDPKKFLEMQRRNPQLTVEEFEFLKSRATLTREFGLTANQYAKVSHGSEQLEGVQVIGGTPNVGLITNTQLDGGRYFTEIENQRRMPVVVIGNDIRERFFQGREPAGKFIDIDGRPYEVIGWAKPKGSVFGQSQDNFVSIPIETYMKTWGSRRGLSYVGLANSRDVLEQAQDEMRALLRAHRHVGPGQEDNFSIISSDSLVSAWDQLTGAIAATAVAVVSVFLVVGGVVIMNIMLAVVTERTREIGVRKAMGARRSDILWQFLVESAMLSGVGGLIGVTAAWLISMAVRAFTPVPSTVPPASVAIAVGISTAVGLFFGIYPARRAAQLDPIEALRAEN
jgi:putative ABC transport system permease protein